MLNVVSMSTMTLEAAVSFGFDRDRPMAGPFLDPLNRRGKNAKELLELVEWAISDEEYVARLERHYAMFKQAVGRKKTRVLAPTVALPKEEWTQLRDQSRVFSKAQKKKRAALKRQQQRTKRAR